MKRTLPLQLSQKPWSVSTSDSVPHTARDLKRFLLWHEALGHRSRRGSRQHFGRPRCISRVIPATGRGSLTSPAPDVPGTGRYKLLSSELKNLVWAPQDWWPQEQPTGSTLTSPSLYNTYKPVVLNIDLKQSVIYKIHFYVQNKALVIPGSLSYSVYKLP